MADRAEQATGPDARAGRKSWRLVGPGVVVAATGVGAGDLVATLIAGSRFGYALLWAAVIGCIVKIALAEATGRWHLATGRTIFEGWRSLGIWTSFYFGIYVVVWGFVYGATAMSSTGLALAALFPVFDIKTWGMIAGVLGLVFVLFNRYAMLELAMKILIGIMFFTVVLLAVLVAPNLGDILTGLVPTIPDGSVIYTLGLIGGVGGTITMAAYGYWINAKGWRTPDWMPMMRLDNRVAYITTGIFVIAMLIVGAGLLHASNVTLRGGDRGLLDLDAILRERFGPFVSTLFLVGFVSTTFSSIIGVWHGVSLLFADFVGHLRGQTFEPGEREQSWPFRFYLFWLTFPPMVLLFLERPFGLVVVYGALGAFFMPFLALTLLWLLNSSRTPAEWRNGGLSNSLLVAAAALFIVLCVHELIGIAAG